MWGSLLAGILARPWARRVAGFALVALTIALFLLNLRRSGERAGRAAERLDNLERSHAIQPPHAGRGRKPPSGSRRSC